MAISLRASVAPQRTLAAARTASGGAPRRSTVQVHADWISDAWMRIFTPAKNDVPRVTNDYSGGSRPRSRSKPFKDGFQAPASSKSKPAPNRPVKEILKSIMSPGVEAAPEEEEEEDLAAAQAEAEALEGRQGPFAYVAAAVRRVMSNNFTSEEGGRSTASTGWKGNVRQRRRGGKGFHSNMY